MDEIKYKVYLYFNCDSNKTREWFEFNNPLLGGLSPNEMIKMGNIKKLEKFIDNQLESN